MCLEAMAAERGAEGGKLGKTVVFFIVSRRATRASIPWRWRSGAFSMSLGTCAQILGVMGNSSGVRQGREAQARRPGGRVLDAAVPEGRATSAVLLPPDGGEPHRPRRPERPGAEPDPAARAVQHGTIR